MTNVVHFLRISRQSQNGVIDYGESVIKICYFMLCSLLVGTFGSASICLMFIIHVTKVLKVYICIYV